MGLHCFVFFCLLEPSPPEYYVGVAMSSTPTRLVQYLLANLTGAVTNLTQSQCQKPDELPNESRQVGVPLDLSVCVQMYSVSLFTSLVKNSVYLYTMVLESHHTLIHCFSHRCTPISGFRALSHPTAPRGILSACVHRYA